MTINSDIKELVIARLQSLPENQKVSIGSKGDFNKYQLIEHVSKEDEIGKKIVEIEMEFLRALKEESFHEPVSGYTPRTRFDDFLSFRLASQILETAEEKGIPYIDCQKEKANKKTVEKTVKTQELAWLFLNGHGSAEAVFGHKDEILFQAGQNEKLLANKIVYALSCKSASILGDASVQAGALSYIGYTDDFLFVFHASYTATPLKDPSARFFLNPSNELALSLMKGNTSREATVHSRNAMMKNIKKLLTSETSPGSETMARYLFWNWKHQTVIGNPNAKIDTT